MYSKSVLLFLSLLLRCWSQEKSYSGYEVVETEIVNNNTLKTLCLHSGQWDFLCGPILGRPAQILVSPEEFSEVQQMLNSENITFQVIENDVQSVMDEEKKKTVPSLPKGSVTFQKYMTLPEIHAYLDSIGERYPKLVKVENIGKSTEGRPIKAVKISSGGEDKPVIFVDATVHAREWIAPCAAMYLINQLVENYTSNSDLVDQVDWYLIPLVNVDGYVYTHLKDRMWRKSRSVTEHPRCKGVDLNRNFPYHWDGSFENHPCSLTYPGKSALSEPEIQALNNYATSVKDRIKLYVSIHTYGEVLLYPWGYTHTPLEDEADLQSLADKVVGPVNAVKSANYSYGSTIGLMYRAPGNSADWAKGTLGVKYSYTIELSSSGYNLFNPPPSVIMPVVTETFEIFKGFAQYFGAGGGDN